MTLDVCRCALPNLATNSTCVNCKLPRLDDVELAVRDAFAAVSDRAGVEFARRHVEDVAVRVERSLRDARAASAGRVLSLVRARAHALRTDPAAGPNAVHRAAELDRLVADLDVDEAYALAPTDAELDGVELDLASPTLPVRRSTRDFLRRLLDAHRPRPQCSRCGRPETATCCTRPPR